MIMTIAVTEMVFHAPLGVYEEERSIGSNLSVHITMDVEVSECAYLQDDLKGTIDYSICHHIASEILSRPIHLLEYAAYSIAIAIKGVSPSLKNVKVKIVKLQPPLPIEGTQTYVEVTL